MNVEHEPRAGVKRVARESEIHQRDCQTVMSANGCMEYMFAPGLLNDDSWEICTVTVDPNDSLSGILRILGRGMDMNGGSRDVQLSARSGR